jgi:YD repeat-containing protein
LYFLIAGLAILALLASYGLHSNSDLWRRLVDRFDQASRGYAVVHGGVAKPDELVAHGKLYFVPMGRQAFPVEALATYYRDKFKIEVTVLPEAAISPTSYDGRRKQYIAEEMILDMKRTHPRISRAADSIMIILTDEDIYPRAFGWRFTYSYHTWYKFAVVSSHRSDPAFWNWFKHRNPAVQLASTKQMLTKYVAMLYFHVPISFDTTSVMYQPLTPDGGSDDLYESDLHSEETPEGFRGSGMPCLIYSYSYATGEMRHLAPSIEECTHRPAPSSPDDEIFWTYLNSGELFETAMDFQLESAPPIEFRRVYRSKYHLPWALGLSINHNYNTWLSSEGGTTCSYIDIVREDDNSDRLDCTAPGSVFSPGVAFVNHQNDQELHGARLDWEAGHYRLQYRDGAWSTFVSDERRCYWNGYQDATGHLLSFDRDASLDLRRLTASDNQNVEFRYDSNGRIVHGGDSAGNRVAYQYDAPGRLVRVTHANGQVTIYSYDLAHQMTQVDVVRHPGDSPTTILTTEYDPLGRAVRQTLKDGSQYRIEYVAPSSSESEYVKITEPSGRVLLLTRPSSDEYVVRTTPIRFPAVDYRAALRP